MAKGYNQKLWRKTVFIAGFLIIVGFGAVIISLFRWQIVRGEEMESKALDQTLRTTELTAKRGTIYDSTGEKVLAQSSSVWTVVLEPAYVTKDETKKLIAEGLSEILDIDEETIYSKLEQKSYFVYLKRKVENDVKDEINQYLLDNKISQGVRLIDDYKRYYPYGTTASTILGFVGAENTGIEGLEYQYDEALSGTAGKLVSAKNAVGTDIPTYEYNQIQDAVDGYDLILSIDVTVQSIIEKHLEVGIEQYEIANGAVGIVMDVNTGAIIALASKGDYDPNEYNVIYDEDVRAAVEDLDNEEERNQAYSDALNKQWRNKAISDTYNPGSVFKMIVGSMGLESGLITENSTFICTGIQEVAGTNGIRCWKRAGHGTETFRDAIRDSCNPSFIQIGNTLGAQTFFDYYEAFGFTQKTGIDLPGEGNSMYYTAETLNASELATSSMGQGFVVTPIQMITGVCAVANGGYLVQPHVVDRIVDSEGNIISTGDTSYKRQVISEETSKIMAEILESNTTDGTANNGYVAGYRIAGKTGTSEKIAEYRANPERGKQYIASYCGFAPAENPQYALLVFFDEPQGSLTGGNAVAGPIFADMMEEILPHLGVDAQYTEQEYEKLSTTAPSVTGFTLEEAYNIISDQGLTYKVIGDDEDGSNVVSAQIPRAGDEMPKGGKVVLYTSGSEDEGDVTVPDFTGLSLTDANYYANQNGLQIKIKGDSDTGFVSAQSIDAESTVKQGTVITLTFVNNVVTDTPT